MHSLVRGFLLSWSGSFVDEKDMESCFVMCVMDHLEEAKIGEPSIIVKA